LVVWVLRISNYWTVCRSTC